MTIDDLRKYSAEEMTFDKLDELIKQRASFEVVGVSKLNAVASRIEGCVEKVGLKCRIYTEYRSSSVAASLFSPTVFLGVAAAVGIGVHNLATFNPDYVIGKSKVRNRIAVNFKK